MTNTDYKLDIDTIKKIRASSKNPAGYNTSVYNNAYFEFFGDIDISETEEKSFKNYIWEVWQGYITK